jgi:hypothetical protein
MHHLLELLAIAGEEDGTCPRAVPDPNDVALHERRPIIGLVEWLVISAVTRRLIGDGRFVEA